MKPKSSLCLQLKNRSSKMGKSESKIIAKSEKREKKEKRDATEAGFEPAHPKVLDSENHVDNSSLTL